MATAIDTPEITGEIPQVWRGEEPLIDGLLEQRGGEWVVAAAFIDYGNTVSAMNGPAWMMFWSRPSNRGVEDMIRQEAEVIAGLIPPTQRKAVVSLGAEFIEGANGHLTLGVGHPGVSALVKNLKAMGS